MDSATFIKVLDLEKPTRLEALQVIFDKLNDMPHSFIALNWHSSHEYLYISENVENLTGYPYKNFREHGIMFLYSVTPPELINHISSTLAQQLAVLEENPLLITNPVQMAVDGGIIHRNGESMPVRCLSTILDYLPGQKRAYLVLSVYISMEDAGEKLEVLTKESSSLQLDLHRLYMEMNPRRFGMVQSFKLLTARELEIAKLIRAGHNSKTIADKLSIALHTVTSHRKSILKKMNANTTTEMVHILNQVS